MSETIQSSDFKIGQAVNSSGKEGVIVERVGPMAHVKFRDGSFSWMPIDELEGLFSETYQKSISCPSCKGSSIEVKSEKAYGSETIYQCMKCSSRFSVQKSEVTKKRKKEYCPNCGKKSGTHKGLDVYECSSCLNKFKVC